MADDAYFSTNLQLSVPERVHAYLQSVTQRGGYTGFETYPLQQTVFDSYIVAEEEITYQLRVTASLCNKDGNLHGGAASTLLDNLSSTALLTIAKPGFWENMGPPQRPLTPPQTLALRRRVQLVRLADLAAKTVLKAGAVREWLEPEREPELVLVLNTVGIRILPGIAKFMVVFLNASAVYIFIVLLSKANPKASAYDAFVQVVNETGWTSDGLVFLLGFLPGVLTVCLPDAAAHMAEEVPSPERTIPLVMFATSSLNAVAGLVMVIALVFCTVAPENLLEPLAGMPIFQIGKDAWDNQGWLITLALIMTIVPLNGAVSIMTGGSRLLWSFSKYGGIVGATFIGRTNTRLQAPVNAILMTGILTALLSLLVFGPTTVLNGIFGSSGVCLAISYFLPISFMLMRDRKSPPGNRYFNLGRWGRPINVAALIWLSLITVMVSFPTYRPVTTTNMNWAAPVFFGLFALAMVNWFFVRHTYTIPKPIYVEGLHGHPAEP